MEPNQDKEKYNVLGDDPFADIEGFAWDDAPAEVDDPFDLLETEMASDDDDLSGVDDLLADTDGDIEVMYEAMRPESKIINPEPEAPANAGSAENAASTHYLDTLIADIDGEIEAHYGVGSMVDLTDEVLSATGLEEQHIIFNLAGVAYTVPIGNVIEIGRPLDITPVPNVPGWVLGVANLRGDVISVVNLRAFLGLPPAELGGNGRLLVAQSHTEEITIGLLVDRVRGIGNLVTDKIGAPTAPIEDQVTPYLRGVYEYDGQLLVVLNLDKLLRSTEMQQFEPM